MHDSSVISRINALLQEAGDEPTQNGNGFAKSAHDPGGHKGKSSHPTAHAEDGTQDPHEGERAHENEEYNKETWPAGVDNIHNSDIGNQDERSLSIGMKSAPTGEDPSVEDDYKGKKDDPGTDHPANVEEIGEKYSSIGYPALLKQASYKINDLMITIAGLVQAGQPVETKTAAVAQPSTSIPAAGQTAVADDARAGYDLAAALANRLGMDKKAMAQAVIEQTILDAVHDAHQVARYYRDHYQAQAKAANSRNKRAGKDDAPPMPPEAMEGGGGGDAGGPGPDAGPMPGGGDMPPGMPGGDMGGGPPPGADMGGGPGGPGGPGGAPPEEAVNEFANALIEMGVPPELLMHAAQKAMGGGGGGGPPPGAGAGGPPPGDMGGGAPPDAKAASARYPMLQKVASSMARYPEEAQIIGNLSHKVINLRGKNGVRLKEATGKARRERDEIKEYVREVCGI